MCAEVLCEIQPSHSQCVRPGSARLLLRVFHCSSKKLFRDFSPHSDILIWPPMWLHGQVLGTFWRLLTVKQLESKVYIQSELESHEECWLDSLGSEPHI